jgi:hypothetical protein
MLPEPTAGGRGNGCGGAFVVYARSTHVSLAKKIKNLKAMVHAHARSCCFATYDDGDDSSWSADKRTSSTWKNSSFKSPAGTRCRSTQQLRSCTSPRNRGSEGCQPYLVERGVSWENTRAMKINKRRVQRATGTNGKTTRKVYDHAISPATHARQPGKQPNDVATWVKGVPV